MAIKYEEIKKKAVYLKLDLRYVVFMVWLISAMYTLDSENTFESILEFFNINTKE